MLVKLISVSKEGPKYPCMLQFLNTHELACAVIKAYLLPKKKTHLNACQVHSIECVSKIKSIFSVIFHEMYGPVCIQLTHLSYDDCENALILSYYHQIGSMTHFPF